MGIESRRRRADRSHSFIRRRRMQLGLTQEALAGNEFTTRFIDALERGAVCPSSKTLELLAHRLQVSVEDLLSAQPGLKKSIAPNRKGLDMPAQEEDLNYQLDYALMLIRSDRVEEALELISEAERSIAPCIHKVSRAVVHRIPFLRGRALLQCGKPLAARAELMSALRLVDAGTEAEARVRNLIGVTYYEMKEPEQALQEHLACLDAINRGAARGFNIQASIYSNLANDYLSLNQPVQALDFYRKALDLLQDLNDLERVANVLWGMAVAYDVKGEWDRGLPCTMRALDIYQSLNRSGKAATVCLDMANMLIKRHRDRDVLPLLERAEALLQGAMGDQTITGLGLGAELYRLKAELARRAGQPDIAAEHATRAVELAGKLERAVETNSAQAEGNGPWVNPVQALADALRTLGRIEEDRGNNALAERLFEQAMDKVRDTGFQETIRTIATDYADMLYARGDLERAVEFYRTAAETRSRYALARLL